MANHIIFELGACCYALSADAVQTTCRLPELSAAQDLPPYFAGLANLHGQVIPIVDLGLRFGQAPQPYRLEQSVVVLSQPRTGRQLGIIADVLLDLVDFPTTLIEPYVQLDGATQHPPQVIDGTVRWKNGVVILLDASALLLLILKAPTEIGPIPTARPNQFVPLDAKELQLLRSRTLQLAQVPQQPVATEHSYVLVRIGDGRFAIALACVAELTRLGTSTPIPCCPAHILGCINLRGAILTVLDVAPLVLGRPVGDYRHVVIVLLGDQRVGLAVHEILDIREYSGAALSPLNGQAFGLLHCKHSLHDADGVVGVLDLATLSRDGLLEVNEQV